MAASLADKQHKQLTTQLEQAEAEVANLKSQRSENQHSHEEELQSLRHTMQLISEQMRSAQTEFDTKLSTAAEELSSVKADSEERSEELARQLGHSDFALRQLRAEVEAFTTIQTATHDDNEQQSHRRELEAQVESLTQELTALKAQHEAVEAEHESLQAEHVSGLEQASTKTDQLQDQVNSLENQLVTTKQQYLQSEEKADRLKTALHSKSASAAEKQTQLETQVSELEQQVQLLTSQSELDAEKTALEKGLQSLQADKDELQQKVVDLKTDLDQSRQQVKFPYLYILHAPLGHRW